VKSANTGEPWGDLKGRFVFGGTAPARAALQITKDQDFCGKHELRDESLVVSADGGLKDVVVFLYLARGEKAPEAHPSYAEAAQEKVFLDNINCRFEPHVCLLQTGQPLQVNNKDEVGHNTKVDTFSNPPINQTIPAGGSFDQSFEQSERKPMPVSCTIHPWMTAHVLIRDNPYCAVSDDNGEFVIKNLPAGKWTFEVWHEKAGNIDKVSLNGAAIAWSKGRFEVTVGGGENDLGEIKIDSAAFGG
jgi:plastocyanin